MLCSAILSCASLLGGPSFSTGANNVTYLSSLDGASLTGIVWLGPNFSPSGPARPLVIYLHAANHDATEMITEPNLVAQFDVRNWIGFALNGRDLTPGACKWEYSAGYIDSPDVDMASGEQDVLDAIDWIASHLPVDADRIFLVGESMGGAGAGVIALKNPHRFAGIGMLASVADMYDFVARDLAVTCLTQVMGGVPGDSLVVDTRFTASSPRFLIENSNNLAVYYGHGLLDLLTYNVPNTPQFQHGWHMTIDGGWAGCHSAGNFCFGHTPTHTELQALDPDGYEWAYQFTDVHHVLDPRWVTGTDAGPNLFGTPDPADPNRLLGMFDFFEPRRRAVSPTKVVFKTYENQHERAYWVRIASTRPWENVPAAVRAVRNAGHTGVSLELARVAEVRIDLKAAGLRLGTRGALKVDVDRLVEPVYDPALDDSAEALTPYIVLEGPVPSPLDVVVKQDGVALSRALLQVGPNEVRIGPISVTGPTSFEIYPKRILTPFAQ